MEANKYHLSKSAARLVPLFWVCYLVVLRSTLGGSLPQAWFIEIYGYARQWMYSILTDHFIFIPPQNLFINELKFYFYLYMLIVKKMNENSNIMVQVKIWNKYLALSSVLSIIYHELWATCLYMYALALTLNLADLNRASYLPTYHCLCMIFTIQYTVTRGPTSTWSTKTIGNMIHLK